MKRQINVYYNPKVDEFDGTLTFRTYSPYNDHFITITVGSLLFKHIVINALKFSFTGNISIEIKLNLCGLYKTLMYHSK